MIGAARHLRPHQRGIRVRDRAIAVVHVVVRVVVLRTANVTRMIAERTARADRLGFRLRSKTATGVHAPHIRRAVAKHIA